jgi:hypothetical protein
MRLITLVVLATGCYHNFKPCGTYSFQATPGTASSFGPTSIPLSVDFSFDPQQCNPPLPVCRCDQIGYVQIVRGSDPTVTPAKYFIAPDAEYFTRQTSQGWSIDISAGRKNGYYGMGDSGMPVTSTILSFGNNGPTPAPAHLHDKPSLISTYVSPTNSSGPPHEVLFEAIDAAVCIAGDNACQGHVFGFMNWWIKLDKNNNVTFVGNRAGDDFSIVFQEALRFWNQHLADGTVIKNALPIFTNLQ